MFAKTASALDKQGGRGIEDRIIGAIDCAVKQTGFVFHPGGLQRFLSHLPPVVDRFPLCLFFAHSSRPSFSTSARIDITDRGPVSQFCKSVTKTLTFVS